MKMSFIAPALGACALLMFPACKSTDGDGYTETALPMSEVADGEIPPWLLEDDGTNGAHVDAGPRTPALADAARNNYSIPEPTETPAASTRQNQPKMAAAGQDDAIVETPAIAAAGTDPLAAAGISATGAVPTAATYTPATPAKTRPASGSKTGSKTATGKKSGSTKGSKKPKQPTMVVYKVRPGDNLSDIAKRSNTTVSQIMRDSNLKSTTIHPGQTIKVRYTPKGYKATKGSANTKGGKTGKSGKTHTITSGQTLSGIASRYGVTTSQLMKANGLTAADAKKIRPGQQLTIPSKSKR